MHDEEKLKAFATSAGLDWATVKAGVLRFLPILEMIAANTSNTYDDAAVAFLKALLNAKV